jgi:predicted dehydrogenase
MNQPGRRSFLQAAVGTALLSAARSTYAANDRINVGIAGVGGRGADHIDAWSAVPGARIVALCDVYETARERGAAHVEKLSGSRPKTYSDLRLMLADKGVDVVSLATPNHWHALGAIWACQAGKDVYVEKPASHNIVEGKLMVEAARKYNRMVQVGLQSRSKPHFREAMDLLHSGAIGKIYLAKGTCYKRRRSIGRKPDSAVPGGLDWDMFLGPAPTRAFNELRFHYNWHWFWDTGNGDIGNQGAHEMDIARWGLNRTGTPSGVVSTGGKFVYDDDQETPNTQVASFDYGDAELVFEVRGLSTGADGGLRIQGSNSIGNLFYGSDGYMALDGDGFRIYASEKNALVKEQKAQHQKDETADHMANFLSAVRSRQISDLHAESEIGVGSATLCHLANISYRTRRRLALNAAGTVEGDDEAQRLYTREYRPEWSLPATL